MEASEFLVHAMKVYEGVEVQFHTILILSLLSTNQKISALGWTRGILLVGGTSSRSSFGMNLVSRNFLLAGGLQVHVSSQLHTLVTLPLGQDRQEPLNRRLGGSCGWSGHFGEHILCPCPESDHSVNIYNYVLNGLNDLCFNF